MQRLQEILNSQPAQDRAEQYKMYLQQVIGDSDGESIADGEAGNKVDKLKEYLQFACLESLGLNVSRQLFQDFIELFGSYCKINDDGTITVLNDDIKENDFKIKVWQLALEKLMTRSVAFEEQISLVSQMLALLLQNNQEWTMAANVLKGIPIDSGTRIVSNSFKFKIYIWIVRLYLEDEDFVSADSFLNRASMISDGLAREDLLQLHACQAQSMDFKRQFVPSALKYFELSNAIELTDVDRMEALKNSVICTVLAGAGPQRSKLLATLYKDLRFADDQLLDKCVYRMLTNMHLKRVCQSVDVNEFEKILRPHQLALLPDGLTVFNRSVIEHNILSLSKLYSNITLKGLGEMLSIDHEKAESMAGKMIVEDRLDAKICQVEKILVFQTESEQQEYQNLVASICEQVENCVYKISIK